MYSKNREDFITIELAAGKNLKVIKLGLISLSLLTKQARDT
jgi:hypothetical protein